MQKRIIKIILACVLIYISFMMLILNYYNGYIVKDKSKFKHFDIMSDSLVIAKIVKDKYNIKGNNNYGLSHIGFLEGNNELKINYFVDGIEKQKLDLSNIKFLEYKSNLGIQDIYFHFYIINYIYH